jgi:hypothetical protein
MESNQPEDPAPPDRRHKLELFCERGPDADLLNLCQLGFQPATLRFCRKLPSLESSRNGNQKFHGPILMLRVLRDTPLAP